MSDKQQPDPPTDPTGTDSHSPEPPRGMPHRVTISNPRPDPARPPAEESLGRELIARVAHRLLMELDPSMDVSHTAEVRRTIEELFEDILAQEKIVLSTLERRGLFEVIVAEILGLGPLESPLADKTVTAIMVNGANNIYVERSGKIYRHPASFDSDGQLIRIIDRIVAPLGRRIDEVSPYVDARLPDGSRVNAVIPPISLVGPALTIRKPARDPIRVEDLIASGSITAEAVEFLKACVLAKLNLVISGGPAAGKTSLLDVLSQYIPPDERVISIENTAELGLRQEHVVTLEGRPPNIEGTGEITASDLLSNVVHMRPDRIVLGEADQDSCLPALRAMRRGRFGVLTTFDASSPAHALLLLEQMAFEGSRGEIPLQAIRALIASSVDTLVHVELFPDGTRRVTHVSEVLGGEHGALTLKQVFALDRTGLRAGRVLGRLRPTGWRPTFMDHIRAAGIDLPSSVFRRHGPRARALWRPILPFWDRLRASLHPRAARLPRHKKEQGAMMISAAGNTADTIVIYGRGPLTVTSLEADVIPVVSAVLQLQSLLDELAGREPPIPVIRSITSHSPVTVTATGLGEAIAVIAEFLSPWRRKHAKRMAELAETEKLLDIEIRKGQAIESRVAAQRERQEAKLISAQAAEHQARAEKLSLETHALRTELKQGRIDLCHHILRTLAPDLTVLESDTYLQRLLPLLDVLAFADVEVTTDRLHQGYRSSQGTPPPG